MCTLRAAIPVVAVLTVCLSACATTRYKTTERVFSDDGISSVTIPADWGRQATLNDQATIQVADMSRENYLIVISEESAELDGVSLDKFANLVVEPIMGVLSGGNITPHKSLKIGELTGLQARLQGQVDGLPVTYLSTSVKGERAYHHILAWTLTAQWAANKDILQAVTHSFRELDQPRQAKARISLKFGWPAQIEADVKQHLSESKNGKVSDIGIKYKMLVSGTQGGFLVQTDDFETKVVTAADDKDRQAYMQDYLRSLTSSQPAYIISSSGKFDKVVKLDEYRDRMKTSVNQLLSSMKNKAEADMAMATIEPMFSEEFLYTAMAEEWNKLVGQWAGASFVAGEDYSTKTVYQMPMLNNQAFTMNVTQRLDGVSDCFRGDQKLSCVKINQHSTVEDSKLNDAFEKFFTSIIGHKINIESVRVDLYLDVITERDTLLPHSVVAKKVIRVDLKIGPTRRTSENIEKNETVYNYRKTSTKTLLES